MIFLNSCSHIVRNGRLHYGWELSTWGQVMTALARGVRADYALEGEDS